MREIRVRVTESVSERDVKAVVTIEAWQRDPIWFQTLIGIYGLSSSSEGLKI